MQQRIVWPSILSLAGAAITLAAFCGLGLPTSPYEIKNGGLGLLWYFAFGLFLTIFSILEFFSVAKTNQLWAYVVLIVSIIEGAFFFGNSNPNSHVWTFADLGPLLGFIGGLWGIVWKRAGPVS